MKIVLDLGNTRLKAAVLIGTDRSRRVRLHAPMATTYKQIERFEQWLQRLPQPPSEVWGINVAKKHKMQAVIKALSPYPCTLRWLGADVEHPEIHNAYDDPGQLGPDRWFGVLGAFALHPPAPEQALLYCSFGTATTIDLVVSRQKAIHYLQNQAPHRPLPLVAKPQVFLGGVILPGPQLMHESLTLHTARLNTGLGSLAEFARNTPSAISSGIVQAQTGALIQQCLHAQALCPELPIQLVCTGGGWVFVKLALQQSLDSWSRVYPYPQPNLQFTEHAVLRGLGTLYFAND